MADHIQIGDIGPRVEHSGDGVTKVFSYPFPIFADIDMRVYVDTVEQVPGTNYTLSGAGKSAGGAVEFVSAPAEGAAVLLLRNLTIARTSDFQSSGEFRAKVINDELDFLTAVTQQINSELGRTLRLQRTDAQASLELPTTASRAGKLLAFDSEGNVAARALADIGIATAISSAIPMTGTAIGSAGTSAMVSAADHSHPLPSVADIGIATQAEAEAGMDNTKAMTPLRTAQAIAQLFDGADQVARDMAASALAYTLATNDAAYTAGSIGKFWLSDDFETDSLLTSTSSTYDGSGYYYVNSSEVVVSAADYLNYVEHGHYSDHVGARAFDGNTILSWTGSGGVNVSAGSHYVGVQLSSASEVTKVRQWVAGNYPASAKVQFSDNGSSWTDAVGGALNYNNKQGSWVETTLASPGSHVYWRIISTTNSQGTGAVNQPEHSWNVYELQFIAEITPPDMTLVPSAVSLNISDPSDVIGYFVFEPVDSVTFGTDLVGKASIDGGTAKATGTWTRIGDIGAAGKELWRFEADVSAQSGSSLTYEITTINNKEIRLHTCVGLIAI
ncbi:MAG: discoidin domain-containing protein [Rhodospirillales bacterium]